MSKQKKIIWFIIAILIITVITVYLFPRIGVCYLYYSIISEPMALETLSVKPQHIELPQPNNSCLFSLSFANAPLCPNSISLIRYTKNIDLIFETDSNGVTYSFLLPQNPVDVNDLAKYSKGSIKNYYDLQVRIANLSSKKYSEILLSKQSDIYLDVILAKFKIVPFNQRGIGFFETDNIKGLIRFGTKNNPCNLMAEVFSKDGKISQIILVTSESPEKSKKALFSLLSSYQFTILEMPDINYLEELIINELGSNSKFEISRENK